MAKSRTRLSNGTTTREEVLLLSVIQAIVKDWARSGTFNPHCPQTHLILTNFRHGGVSLTHVSVSGSMSSTMTRGLLGGDDAQMVVGKTLIGEGLVPGPHGMPPGSRSGSPTCPPAAKDRTQLELSCTPASQRRSPPPEEAWEKKSTISGLFRYLPQHTHLLATKRWG